MADDKTKRENFARLYPPAVEKLVDRLRVVKQKSAKGNYAWDQAVVHDSWVQIARIFIDTAAAFDVEFDVLVDGDQVEYAKPKSRRTKMRNPFKKTNHPEDKVYKFPYNLRKQAARLLFHMHPHAEIFIQIYYTWRFWE